MNSTEPRPANRLLMAFPDAVWERTASQMDRVQFKSGQVLHRPGEPINNLHFPLDCVISITVTMSDGRIAETGIVGRRELVGLNAFMGGRETTQTEYVVQVPGEAIRVPAKLLRDEFDQNEDLRRVLLHFTQAMFAQVTQNAACNGLHPLEQRFARWLLEFQDRIGIEHVTLTQDHISQILSTRRASVTQASRRFVESGLIRQSRGMITILDQAGLEDEACECYRVLRDEYDRLLSS